MMPPINLLKSITVQHNAIINISMIPPAVSVSGKGWRGETRDYDYDGASRLTNVQSLSNPESFIYDALGNRQNGNAQFDAANRITQDNNFTYTYDINGNRTEKVNKLTGEVERYSYNSLDQLIRYRVYPDNNTATVATVDYTYDYGPLGRRWSKQNTLAAGATQFYWSGANLIGENNGGTVRRYLLEGVTPTGFVENGQVYHYLKDHLGTAHEIVDESGDTLWQGDYTSFGEVAETINLVDNNLRFAGQYQDQESGLYYNYFRYYDPELGRYITSDPIGLNGGMNTYLYANVNPLIYADPYGLYCLTNAQIGAISGAIGGGLGGIIGGAITGAHAGGIGGAISDGLGGGPVGGAAGGAVGGLGGTGSMIGGLVGGTVGGLVADQLKKNNDCSDCSK